MAAKVCCANAALAVSIITSPAEVRMAVTLPQKYVLWTVMIVSATAVMAPRDTACVHSSMGAAPLQSRSKSWSCATRYLLLPPPASLLAALVLQPCPIPAKSARLLIDAQASSGALVLESRCHPPC